ncbi:hypothetical protein LJK88_50780 [Paenibacillus sp. P26]|nr:hypothetical protein LJK88_50780 [Paenibacillus sp. P26]UUZ91332.1 hypothetical protein LJK87_37590 [Paenibacillus sp. P25]
MDDYTVPGGGELSPKARAQTILSKNPDHVFEEAMRVTIDAGDIDFWLKFASEWGGALYLLDEKNTRRYDKGDISQEEFEYSKRTYRLGLITLSGFYDKLKAWTEAEKGDYLFTMDHLESYFIPSYLDDYSRVYAGGKAQCEAYIQRMVEALSAGGDLKRRVEDIQALVQEYIHHMHLYARS